MPASVVTAIAPSVTPDTLKLVIAVGSMAFGGISTAFLAKYFLTKYIRDNDLKHHKSEEDAKLKHDTTTQSFSDVKHTLATISASLKVTTALFNEFKIIKEVVDKDHDSIVILREKDGSKDKLLADHHDQIKVVQHQLSEVREMVSTIRRLNK